MLKDNYYLKATLLFVILTLIGVGLVFTYLYFLGSGVTGESFFGVRVAIFILATILYLCFHFFCKDKGDDWTGDCI